MSNKFKKQTFYWSDRWQRVIKIYECKKCGYEESTLNNGRKEIEENHECKILEQKKLQNLRK